MSNTESERVAVVTGASRGAGKGIALALGAAGVTVYVTGRTTQPGTNPLPGTVYETAQQVTEAGGKGVAVVCDHGDDAQVEDLFKRVQREHGYLDILVNNAQVAPDGVLDYGPFWERPMNLIDMLEIGTRSSYVASWFAAPLLLKSKAGLLVNTSGFGGGCYLHGPAYGAGKAAADKMARDMGIDFRAYNVCAVSLWMALLRTERTEEMFRNQPDVFGDRAKNAESPLFIGRVIDALSKAPDRMERTAKVWIAAELGQELGVLEDDGSQPVSCRKPLGGPWDYNPAIIGLKKPG